MEIVKVYESYILGDGNSGAVLVDVLGVDVFLFLYVFRCCFNAFPKDCEIPF